MSIWAHAHDVRIPPAGHDGGELMTRGHEHAPAVRDFLVERQLVLRRADQYPAAAGIEPDELIGLGMNLKSDVIASVWRCTSYGCSIQTCHEEPRRRLA